MDTADRDEATLEAEAKAAGITPERLPSRVSLKDHRTGVTIGLLNESKTDQADFYSQVRSAPTYKVVPDLDMGALMAQLKDFGYFNAASSSTARVPGARITVQVERGGLTRTLAYTTESNAERVQLVQDCSTAIRAIYNLHQAYQVIDNPKGTDYFEEEAARLKKVRPQN